MAEKLCLEDLQSPALQQATAQLQQEREKLVNQLTQLQQLQPDTEAAEEFLQAVSDEQSAQPTIQWLRSLRQLTLVLCQS